MFSLDVRCPHCRATYDPERGEHFCPPPPPVARTHWEGCWKDHADCARARVVELESKLQACELERGNLQAQNTDMRSELWAEQDHVVKLEAQCKNLAESAALNLSRLDSIRELVSHEPSGNRCVDRIWQMFKDVERPRTIGVDMASGPDVTAYRCTRCGHIQRHPLVGPPVCPNCG